MKLVTVKTPILAIGDTELLIILSCVELKDDLNAIIQCSRENEMKLHEDEFDLISNGANPKLLMHEQQFSMETCTIGENNRAT